MELREINCRLSATDHLAQVLEQILKDKCDSCAYKEVVGKVMGYVDDLNWEYVVMGEKEIQSQEQLDRELAAVTSTSDNSFQYVCQ